MNAIYCEIILTDTIKYQNFEILISRTRLTCAEEICFLVKIISLNKPPLLFELARPSQPRWRVTYIRRARCIIDTATPNVACHRQPLYVRSLVRNRTGICAYMLARIRIYASGR